MPPNQTPNAGVRNASVVTILAILACGYFFECFIESVVETRRKPPRRNYVTVQSRKHPSQIRQQAGTNTGLSNGFDIRSSTNTRQHKPQTAPSVTVAALSCKRHDLLKDTLSTFESYNTFPISARFVLDCDNSSTALKVAQSIHRGYTAVPAAARRTDLTRQKDIREHNIVDNIIALYAVAPTEYVYFTEGDWNTTRDGFIDEALAILQSAPGDINVSTVLARKALMMKEVNHKETRNAVSFLKKRPFEWGYSNCPAGGAGNYGSWSNNPHVCKVDLFRKYMLDGPKPKDEVAMNRKFWRESGFNEGLRRRTYECLRNMAQPFNDAVYHTGGSRHINLKR